MKGQRKKKQTQTKVCIRMYGYMISRNNRGTGKKEKQVVPNEVFWKQKVKNWRHIFAMGKNSVQTKNER